MSIFNQLLNVFPLSRKLRRLVWALYNLKKRRHVYHDPHYFDNLFATFCKHNLLSIDTTQGLVRGRFQGVEYLLRMRPGNYIESSVFLKGIWEPHIVELIASYLQSPNQIVVDIGANVGATSIPLAKKYPNTDFHLFEPHPQVFSNLLKNCAFNQLSNVKPVNAAVSDQSDLALTFYAQQDAKNMGLSSLKPNPDIKNFDIIKVQGIRIDDAFRDINQSIAVIKIDTQGSELDVLKSAKNTISTHRPVIFFEFESEYFPDPDEESRTRADIMAFFEEQRYELYCLQPESAYLPAVKLHAHFHGDLLAVPV